MKPMLRGLYLRKSGRSAEAGSAGRAKVWLVFVVVWLTQAQSHLQRSGKVGGKDNWKVRLGLGVIF